MSSSVTLTAATRQNLLSLQDTASLMATTQNRLATGKKVNSALDNPLNFFTAQSLDNRSSDLSGLLDGMSNGVQTIQAANQGITSIQKLIDSAKSIANQALASKNSTVTTPASTTSTEAADDYEAALTGTTAVTFTVDGVSKTATLAAGTGTAGATVAADVTAAVAELNRAAGVTAFAASTDGLNIVVASDSSNIELDATESAKLGFSAAVSGTDAVKTEDKTRTNLTKQYNDLLDQISEIASDASYNGVNLLNGGGSNQLKIQFNENGNSSLTIAGVDFSSGGLGLTAVPTTGTTGANFQDDADIETVMRSLTTASSTLRAQSSAFGSNLSVVQNRQDFSKQVINILGTGASNLTAADLNEEAANSQALTTRQSLSISALSLANQAQQGILQLLR